MFFIFPFKIHRPQKRIPYLTFGLIAVNVLVSIGLLFSPDKEALYREFGFMLNNKAWYTWLTYMFVHASPPPLGNILHLLGNMVVLYVFGTLLEDVLGWLKFAVVYVLSGAASIALFIMMNMIFVPEAKAVPLIGASGAIFGLLGIAMLRFKKNKITFAYFFWLIFLVRVGTFTLSAFWAVLFYFAEQVALGLIQLNAGGVGGVAYWGHIGGFLVGLTAVSFLNLSEEAEVEYKEADAASTGRIGSFAISAEKYESLTAKQPDNPDFYRQAGKMWSLAEKEEKAVGNYLKAFNIYLGKGQKELASQVYAELHDFYPGHVFDAPTLFKISSLCQSQFKFQAALEGFQQIISNYPDSDEVELATLRIAQVYQKMGEVNKAADQYKVFLDEYPNSQWAGIATEWLNETQKSQK